jgi:hypothetical protein
VIGITPQKGRNARIEGPDANRNVGLPIPSQVAAGEPPPGPSRIFAFLPNCVGNQVAMRTIWRIEFNGVGATFSPQSTSRSGLPDVSAGRIIPTGPPGSRIAQRN